MHVILLLVFLPSKELDMEVLKWPQGPDKLPCSSPTGHGTIASNIWHHSSRATTENSQPGNVWKIVIAWRLILKLFLAILWVMDCFLDTLNCGVSSEILWHKLITRHYQLWMDQSVQLYKSLCITECPLIFCKWFTLMKKKKIWSAQSNKQKVGKESSIH